MSLHIQDPPILTLFDHFALVQDAPHRMFIRIVEIKVETAKEIRLAPVIKFLQIVRDPLIIQGRILPKEESSDRPSPLIFSSSQVPTIPRNHNKSIVRRRPTILPLLLTAQLLRQPSHLLRTFRLVEKLLQLLERTPDLLRLMHLFLIQRRS